jgi:hypothetical protein
MYAADSIEYGHVDAVCHSGWHAHTPGFGLSSEGLYIRS